VKLTIYTAYLRDQKPNSVIVIAKPESGKTEVMKRFRINKNIAYVSDVTAFGIQRDYLSKIEAGEVRHSIIPDLLKPLSRKESTVNSFITLMNSLIEEGVAAVSTYASPGLLSFSRPLKCGLITAITGGEFRDQRHNWEKKGFLSRTILFSYSYGFSTVNKVFESILELDYIKERHVKLDIPKKDPYIRLPRKFARSILPTTAMIAKAEKTYGFRLQKQFQALMQASALEHHRRVVNKADVQRVLRLMQWVNFDEKPITGGS
jgi:hypothetical protein